MSTSSQPFPSQSSQSFNSAPAGPEQVQASAPTSLPPAPEPQALMATPEPPLKRSCFRVNYFVRGQVKTAFVCAFTGGEASAFLGVEDGSASAYSVASPVEVVGVDPDHAPLPKLPIIVTNPPAAPLTDAEVAILREFTPEEIATLHAILAKK